MQLRRHISSLLENEREKIDDQGRNSLQKMRMMRERSKFSQISEGGEASRHQLKNRLKDRMR